MMLLACDQSVRGFAIAAAPLDWGGDWNKVVTGRFDGGSVSRGDEAGAEARFIRLYRWFDSVLVNVAPNLVGFESYAFSSRPDVHVVELVGACKLRINQYGCGCQTVNQSSARKLLLAKVPRKGAEAKAAVHSALVAGGAPAGLSLDATDAICVLNSMMSEKGGYCFGQV